MIGTGQVPHPSRTSPLWWRLAYPSGRCAALVRLGHVPAHRWEEHPSGVYRRVPRPNGGTSYWHCSRCGCFTGPYCLHIRAVRRHLGPGEAPSLAGGYLRRWLPPHDGATPARVEGAILAYLIAQEATALRAAAAAPRPDPPPDGQAAPEDLGERERWIRGRAAGMDTADRSRAFHSLAWATYRKYGEAAARAHAGAIDEATGGKYGGRAEREVERSLTDAPPHDPDRPPGPFAESTIRQKHQVVDDRNGDATWVAAAHVGAGIRPADTPARGLPVAAPALPHPHGDANGHTQVVWEGGALPAAHGDGEGPIRQKEGGSLSNRSVDNFAESGGDPWLETDDGRYF